MDILANTMQIKDYIIKCRRHLYANPEISDEEFKTLAFIKEELTAMGLNFVHIQGGGIMVFIEGIQPGKTVFLRADIDALPIQEADCNEKQPKACLSTVPGVAHLCGHEAHTAMLLGAAKLLGEHKDEIQGRVILFFEQGEENGHGDIHMMRYIEDNKVQIDSCWAMHVLPDLDMGQVCLIPGGIFAGAIDWDFTVAGKNSAAAIDCCASIVNALHNARLSDVTPFEGLTVSCCLFRSDKEAGTCRIAGSCRFYDRDKAGLPIKRAFRRIVKETCLAYGCTLKEEFMMGPKEGLLNDPTCVQIARKAVGDALGTDKLATMDPTMYGESFTLLASYYPSVMALLGVRDTEKGFTAPLHNPKFEANEEALPYGAAATVAYALAFLNYKDPIPFKPFQGNFDTFLQAREEE